MVEARKEIHLNRRVQAHSIHASMGWECTIMSGTPANTAVELEFPAQVFRTPT